VAAGDGTEAGTVRLLVVPNMASEGGRVDFKDLEPPPWMVREIRRRLDECRLVGTELRVGAPDYQGLTVVARLRARPRFGSDRLKEQALEALYTYFHPLVGGPEGTGWPFGRPVHVGEVPSVLQGLRGAELVEDVRLFSADRVTGTRGDPTQRLDVVRHALVFSYEHQVRVDEG
jgi:predicted phage baseplate assembly protein